MPYSKHTTQLCHAIIEIGTDADKEHVHDALDQILPCRADLPSREFALHLLRELIQSDTKYELVFVRSPVLFRCVRYLLCERIASDTRYGPVLRARPCRLSRICSVCITEWEHSSMSVRESVAPPKNSQARRCPIPLPTSGCPAT